MTDPTIPSSVGFQRASLRVRQAETCLAATLVGVIFLLLLANVVSRSLGHPLIWTDELAVHLMVWVAFLGASLGIATRTHMAVGLLPERLSPPARRWLLLGTDTFVLGFMLVIGVLTWRWLDLPGLIRAGSAVALAEQTFNFVYVDPTSTLGVRKIWFWLILPATCATGAFHALAAVLADVAALRGRS